MDREYGYYWVMEFKGTTFEVALWDGNKFWVCGCGDYYREDEFYSINETKIIPSNV
jgi:hypothetical protein